MSKMVGSAVFLTMFCGCDAGPFSSGQGGCGRKPVGLQSPIQAGARSLSFRPPGSIHTGPEEMALL